MGRHRSVSTIASPTKKVRYGHLSNLWVVCFLIDSDTHGHGSRVRDASGGVAEAEAMPEVVTGNGTFRRLAADSELLYLGVLGVRQDHSKCYYYVRRGVGGCHFNVDVAASGHVLSRDVGN